MYGSTLLSSSSLPMKTSCFRRANSLPMYLQNFWSSAFFRLSMSSCQASLFLVSLSQPPTMVTFMARSPVEFYGGLQCPRTVYTDLNGLWLLAGSLNLSEFVAG